MYNFEEGVSLKQEELYILIIFVLISNQGENDRSG